MRSFRAETLAHWVEAVLDGEVEKARRIHDALSSRYPILITRDIERGREWLRSKARASERFGILASSGAIRLRPEGINVKANIEPAQWFLNGKYDVRSSYYLEDVGTEFAVQGLELDWTLVGWDGDLRRVDNVWSHFSFKGSKWQNVNQEERRRYLGNAYRVLLTRARQGMVIFVPKGDDRDHTRPPEFYDETYAFLKSCGLMDV